MTREQYARIAGMLAAACAALDAAYEATPALPKESDPAFKLKQLIASAQEAALDAKVFAERK